MFWLEECLDDFGIIVEYGSGWLSKYLVAWKRNVILFYFEMWEWNFLGH